METIPTLRRRESADRTDEYACFAKIMKLTGKGLGIRKSATIKPDSLWVL